MSNDNSKLFSEARKRRGAALRRAIVSLLAAAAASVSLSSASMIPGLVTYAVSYEGSSVGVVSDRAEVDAALRAAEERAADILGEEIDLAEALTVTPRFGGDDDGAVSLASSLLSSVEGITEGDLIMVNGVPVCAVEDASGLHAALEALTESYVTESTLSAKIIENVTVTRGFVSEERLTASGALREALCPFLTVETVEGYSEEVPLSFETEYIYDEEMYSDEFDVTQYGSDGVMLEHWEKHSLNGVEVSREMTGEEMLVEPVAEIYVLGTKEGLHTDSRGYYIWPCSGIITSPYGTRSGGIGSSNHKGIDIGADYGTEIYASDSGDVIQSAWVDGYGNFIKIQHDNGDITCYGHLQSRLVSEGDRVIQGDQIATMGSTGRSTGPHLHFEIRLGGTTQVNPVKLLPKE